MKRRTLLAAAAPLCFQALRPPAGARAAAPAITPPSWEALARREAAPPWFRDAKFGIYFHWGVYSVPAFGDEWYPRNMHLQGKREHEHHLATYGHPSRFGYHDFVPKFRAERFDPDAWATLFAQAGARFAGPVAEHHDGFSMWASKVNPWNARQMGPRRDLVGALEKAIRRKRMKFIATFHHDRHCQLYQDAAGEKKFGDSHYPFLPGMPPTSNDPKLKLLYGNLPPQECYERFWLGKLREVIDGYRPDLIWFDSWLDRVPDERRRQFADYYLRRAGEWGREVVITYKQKDLPPGVGVLDLEKGRMENLTDFVWLTDDTLSTGSWSYTEDLKIKTTATVLHSLIDIVSKNGVLLLNISPRADGTIPDDQQQVLREMGAWLGKHGEAIYGTRPWHQYGEGPTKLQKGHFGGVTDKEPYTPRDLRYTTRGSTIYVIALGWPGDTPLLATGFVADAVRGKLNVERVSLLGSRTPVRWKMGTDGLALSVTGPSADAGALGIVFKVQTAPAG